MPTVTCPHCHNTFEVSEQLVNSAVEQEVSRQVTTRVAQEKEEMRKAFASQYEFQKQQLEKQNQDAVDLVRAEERQAATQQTSDLVIQVSNLQNQLKTQESVEKAHIDAAVAEANATSAQQINALQIQLVQNEAAYAAERARLEGEIKAINDMRSKMSVKVVGEELEQHCNNEFQALRARGGFQNATFEKDNEAVRDEGETRGTKGDFIYRETTDDGVEFLSIMFEMKNESENSEAANRKTNESHLAKLNRDRNKKKCEYAVLVTTLEPDNDLYNAGIVDASLIWPEYQKMFIVRPQCFTAIIGLLRSTQAKIGHLKARLEQCGQKDLDIVKFRTDCKNWVEDILKTDAATAKNIENAISSIDDSIADLEKTKRQLKTALGRIETLDKKARSTTLQRIIDKNETVRELIEKSPEM